MAVFSQALAVSELLLFHYFFKVYKRGLLITALPRIRHERLCVYPPNQVTN